MKVLKHLESESGYHFVFVVLYLLNSSASPSLSQIHVGRVYVTVVFSSIFSWYTFANLSPWTSSDGVPLVPRDKVHVRGVPCNGVRALPEGETHKIKQTHGRT